MTRLKLPEMKTGWVISAIVHAALLVWGLISFSVRPLDAKPTDALPVDIISTSEFSQLTKGVKNAPKVETPKPLVDKVGLTKPVDEVKPKVVDKPEIKTSAAEQEPAPPEPKPKPPELKPEKKPEPKVDPIAEKLKRDEQQRKLADAKAKAEAKKKPLPPQPKFDANQIAALLDKRDATRTTSTGETPNAVASLGTPTGAAPKLSQSELDAMRSKLMQLWNPPAGAQNPQELIVKIRIQLRRDGTLADWPVVLASGKGELGVIARENAVRAINRGQPFTMLSPATYDLWKEIEITFDPRDMFR